ncbi:MAG: ParB N-terminal domain-containing protein [Proteobacteria bacterium]|nr:ParB N-terminal domain-containing protein [Pseudomonadota bacterium]
MLTTKRFDYVAFEAIQVHPDVSNHRSLDPRKVEHYQHDILKNGLLEPLVVWEKRPGQLFLVGGFHRRAAIDRIRRANPGYFDRVDTRVVAGDLDEIRALNLKLNADRLDAKITDYFDVVVYLNNANWSAERIGQFLDKSESWVGDILRYAPSMDARVRDLVAAGKLSWNRAKTICRAVQDAAPGEERRVLEEQLRGATNGGASGPKPRKPLTLRHAKKRLGLQAARHPERSYQVNDDDLLALLLVVEGKYFEPEHLERVRRAFPSLAED